MPWRKRILHILENTYFPSIFSSSPRSLINLNRGGKVYEHGINLAASRIEGKPETGEKAGGAKRGRGRRMPSQS